MLQCVLVSMCTSSFLCNSKPSYQVRFQCTAPWWHMEHLQRSSIRCRTAYSVHTGHLHSVVCARLVLGRHILNCTWSIGWLAVQCYLRVRAMCLFGRVVCVVISVHPSMSPMDYSSVSPTSFPSVSYMGTPVCSP